MVQEQTLGEGTGPAVELWVDSLIVALVAIRKRVCVSVVEETMVSVSPGELLQVGGGEEKHSHVSWLLVCSPTATRLSGATWRPWCGCAGGCRGRTLAARGCVAALSGRCSACTRRHRAEPPRSSGSSRSWLREQKHPGVKLRGNRADWDQMMAK